MNVILDKITEKSSKVILRRQTKEKRSSINWNEIDDISIVASFISKRYF